MIFRIAPLKGFTKAVVLGICSVPLGLLAGCRPSEILSVPLPAGIVGSNTLQNQSGAETAFSGAKAQLFNASIGSSELIQWATLLSDEATWSDFTYAAAAAHIDARFTAGGGGFVEEGDNPLINLLTARSSLLIVIPALAKFEPPSRRSVVGEAYSLVGYSEIFIAEDYCAGVPLDAINADGGVDYSAPLSADSVLGLAESHFSAAISAGGGNDSIISFASIGLARARMDRGNWSGAGDAAKAVPIGYTYNAELEANLSGGTSSGPSLYGIEFQYSCGLFNAADGKGHNGLNYVSAGDPRLVIDSTAFKTCDGGTWYYPVKFGLSNQTSVPLATGIEAQLIMAEASLNTQAPGNWSATLNALRADSADTKVGGLQPLGADSTTAAPLAEQVDVMFRERAFWLYGTGTRLGDMRRLVRQYRRSSTSVFPIGQYPNGNNSLLPAPIPSYGSDVDFTLPTGASGLTTTNPSYRGCLTPPSNA